MFEHALAYEPNTTQVVIQAAKTIEIRGVDHPAAEIRYDAATSAGVQAQQAGSTLYLNCDVRCELALPR